MAEFQDNNLKFSDFLHTPFKDEEEEKSNNSQSRKLNIQAKSIDDAQNQQILMMKNLEMENLE